MTETNTATGPVTGVIDALGDVVSVGDVIAYGSLLGRSAALKFGRVEALTPRTGGGYSVVVRGGRRVPVWDHEARRYTDRYEWTFDRKGCLDASLRRFIRLTGVTAAQVPEPPCK